MTNVLRVLLRRYREGKLKHLQIYIIYCPVYNYYFLFSIYCQGFCTFLTIYVLKYIIIRIELSAQCIRLRV